MQKLFQVVQRPSNRLMPAIDPAVTGVRTHRLFYYTKASDSDMHSSSRAKSLPGAIRAAITHLLMGKFEAVEIYHEEGYHLASISLGREGKRARIQIYGFLVGVL